MAKLPQKENDVAIMMTVAVGPRNFVFTSNNHDDRFTDKLKRVAYRVAERAKVTAYVGHNFATLRYPSTPHINPPDFYFDTPRELAIQLMVELAKVEGEK